MHIDLNGRVALVTGASGELGRVIARTLAGCGARVALHYRRNASAAKALLEDLPGSCLVQADITKEQEVIRMRDEIERALGAPDIIVNNAVVQYAWKRVLDQPVEDYRSQFESCVLQNVLMAKIFVPAMMKRKWGRVIAINTECAMQCAPGQSAYVSGKRGMDGVLRCLAREVGEYGITVNQVAPGWMISDKDRVAGDETGKAAYIQKIPLRHRGEDQDVANTVAYLASDYARFISGVYLPVCGGNVMPTI